MLAAAAMFVAAGGYIHLREWLTLYRHVPADSPGAAVVRLGFPLNAASSFVLAAALAVLVVHRSRLSPYVVGSAFFLQLGSLAALIATRTGSLLGWTEPSWTSAANQTRAVEIGALIALASIPIVSRVWVVSNRRPRRPFDSSSDRVEEHARLCGVHTVRPESRHQR